MAERGGGMPRVSRRQLLRGGVTVLATTAVTAHTASAASGPDGSPARPDGEQARVINVGDFGADVAFWRRPMNASFAAVLDDFLRLEPGPERWDDPAFASVLSTFKQRFIESNTEEGRVMATVLTYTMDQAYTSGRRALIAEFRSSDEVRRLIDLGVRRRSHEID